MREARATIAAGGRLIIPVSIRKELNLKEGQEVILKVESGELHVLTYQNAIKHAQSIVRQYNKKNLSLTEALINMRKEESDND